VNDGLGHAAGDQLLKQVSERLTATVRSSDQVARLGGDEFAVLQWGQAVSAADAMALATRIGSEMNKPFLVAGQSVSIGVSIGIALVPDHGATPEDVTRNADIALYRAKTGGRGSAVVFEPEFARALTERRCLEQDLRRALSEPGQLELYYQPIVGLRHQGVIACEALMRWRHPQRGFVSPAEFIPLAEETGLIGALGAFALKQTCNDATQWPGALRVSVNLSAAQFMDPDFSGLVRNELAASGLDAGRLELEVTETLLLQDNARTKDVLHKLRALGISIALDDFGTGYASLS
jgi:diguanylate cyclase (GGDEF)-like protein